MNLTSDWLALDDAEIYYERRGAGPLLVLIPGGPQDAGVFAGLGGQLANRYTVVSFDPRGNSRTRTVSPPGELEVARHADDVAALISALGAGSAYVFGTSGGGQIALDLAARHPGRVTKLVAHEPPTAMLLDDPETVLADGRRLHRLFKQEGPERAMAEFFAMNGLDTLPDMEQVPPEAAETMARVGGNFAYWLEYGMLPLTTYTPDVERLRGGSVPIAVGLGEGSAGQPIEKMTLALAERLGVDTAAFPGDHTGYEMAPAAFAERLASVLSQGA